MLHTYADPLETHNVWRTSPLRCHNVRTLRQRNGDVVTTLPRGTLGSKVINHNCSISRYTLIWNSQHRVFFLLKVGNFKSKYNQEWGSYGLWPLTQGCLEAMLWQRPHYVVATFERRGNVMGTLSKRCVFAGDLHMVSPDRELTYCYIKTIWVLDKNQCVFYLVSLNSKFCQYFQNLPRGLYQTWPV